jgi:hypothetical protein
MGMEGAKCDVLPELLQSPVSIKQLLIEFHHRTGIESLATTVTSVERLRDAGFDLFHVSETSSEFSFSTGKHLSIKGKAQPRELAS